MQWFIKEQVEEVATMSDLLTVVKRSRNDVEAIEDYVQRETANEGVGPDRADRGRRLTRAELVPFRRPRLSCACLCERAA